MTLAQKEGGKNITKIGTQDDPKAFLETSEWVTRMCQWPWTWWATQLDLYLTEGQEAYWVLGVEATLDCEVIKAAIFDLLGLT